MSYRTAILRQHKQRQENRKRRLRQEAERLCRSAAKKFSFRKMYIYGSTVNTRPVSVWSDIDLIVEGLADDKYYAMAGYLNTHSGNDVDLKTYETLRPEFRDAIASDGITIYERR